MIRFAILMPLALAVVTMACNGGGATETEYEVTVEFNTSVMQDGIDEVEAILRRFDDDLEFLIQESFPPTGRAFLETDAVDFCPTVEAELEAKSFVDAVLCQEG